MPYYVTLPAPTAPVLTYADHEMWWTGLPDCLCAYCRTERALNNASWPADFDIDPWCDILAECDLADYKPGHHSYGVATLTVLPGQVAH